jgi:hypothetical protein
MKPALSGPALRWIKSSGGHTKSDRDQIDSCIGDLLAEKVG